MYLEKMLSNLEGLGEDIEVLRVNVQVDNVHVVVIVPPKVSVASIVQFMKSRTGKKLKERFDFMNSAIRNREGIWSRGYCVSSIGMDEKKIMEYVKYQEKEDKGQLKLF